MNIILFNINLLAFVICYTIELIIPESDKETLALNHYISLIFCSTFIYILPRFSHSSFKPRIARKLDIFFLSLSITFITSITVSEFLVYIPQLTPVIYISMLSSIAYAMIIMIHPKIGTKGTMFHLRTGIISLISLPLTFFIDKFPETRYWDFNIPEHLIIFPAFYFVLNIDLLNILKRKLWNEDFSINNFLQAYNITARERDVLNLLIEGESYKKIGERLHISLSTVKTHINSLYKKTSTSNKIELISIIRKQAD